MNNAKSDRDAVVDRLLAGTLQAGAEPAPGETCLDAETLAAWADQELDAEPRAIAEAHAADCARCQALLAAMVRTMPPRSAATSTWRIPARGWLIPLAGAAAAVAIWVLVPTREPLEQRSPSARATDRVAIAPATPAANTPAQDALAPAKPAAAPVERQNAATLDKQGAEAREKKAPASPSVSPLSETVIAGRAAPDALRRDAAKSRVAPEAAEGAPARALASPRAAAPGILIVSPNPAIRWRIEPGGAVQRSADGGSTWQTEDTGTTVTLAAGAAPSPSVCWLVGPGGTVVRTTDGRTWQRIAFSDSAALTAISAADDQTATVTAADGRTFSTTDGGLTWRR